MWELLIALNCLPFLVLSTLYKDYSLNAESVVSEKDNFLYKNYEKLVKTREYCLHFFAQRIAIIAEK